MWLINADPLSDPYSLIDVISRGGALAFAVIFAWLFLTDRIVTGKRYTSDTALLRAERDRAVDLLYQVTGVTQRAVSITQERLELEKQVAELRQKAGLP